MMMLPVPALRGAAAAAAVTGVELANVPLEGNESHGRDTTTRIFPFVRC